MNGRLLAIGIALFPVCFASLGQAEDQFKSREYKLGLVAAKFQGKDPGEVAKEFWKDVLRPAIRQSLDNGDERAQGKFDELEQRLVMFRDTSSCALAVKGLVLRERTDLASGARSVTLKYRALAGSEAAKVKLFSSGDASAVEPKLEEDVSATRTLFSSSATRGIQPESSLAHFADAEHLFGTLRTNLGDQAPEAAGLLQPGHTIRELAFKGAEVQLGHEKAKFSLTLWYDTESPKPQPMLAEISFRHDLHGISDEALKRAKTLFSAMQSGMGDWTGADVAGKTSSGVPGDCAAKLVP